MVGPKRHCILSQTYSYISLQACSIAAASEYLGPPAVDVSLSDHTDSDLPEPRPAQLGRCYIAHKSAQDDTVAGMSIKRRNGRTNLKTWHEARDACEDEGEPVRIGSYHEIWYCKHCESTTMKKPNSVTTNLDRARKHLRVFHGVRIVKDIRADIRTNYGPRRRTH